MSCVASRASLHSRVWDWKCCILALCWHYGTKEQSLSYSYCSTNCIKAVQPLSAQALSATMDRLFLQLSLTLCDLFQGLISQGINSMGWVWFWELNDDFPIFVLLPFENCMPPKINIVKEGKDVFSTHLNPELQEEKQKNSLSQSTLKQPVKSRLNSHTRNCWSDTLENMKCSSK